MRSKVTWRIVSIEYELDSDGEIVFSYILVLLYCWTSPFLVRIAATYGQTIPEVFEYSNSTPFLGIWSES